MLANDRSVLCPKYVFLIFKKLKLTLTSKFDYQSNLEKIQKWLETIFVGQLNRFAHLKVAVERLI